jgi:hypothetical protein
MPSRGFHINQVRPLAFAKEFTMSKVVGALNARPIALGAIDRPFSTTEDLLSSKNSISELRRLPKGGGPVTIAKRNTQSLKVSTC